MTLNMQVSRLGAVHRILAEALTELDRMGEVAAAAHLAAALDAIEGAIEAQATDDAEGGPLDGTADARSPITLIARQMQEMFGDRAEAVARRQLAAASGPSLTTWAAIVNDIIA